MRLGGYDCEVVKDSLARELYKKKLISERHRHRWEFNNKYREQFTGAGLVISGVAPDRDLVEIVELADHPWFVGSQFHPELKSRPTRPHPLFSGFVGAALDNQR